CALRAAACVVIALVMRRAVARAALGVALGTGAALLAARAMRSLLFGVGAADPLSFVGVAALLFLVAGAAKLVPRVRAAVWARLLFGCVWWGGRRAFWGGGLQRPSSRPCERRACRRS